MKKKISKFFESKIVIFLFQIILLSLLIHIFTYNFNIDFDKNILKERNNIIQFIANYVIFTEQNGASFIPISWFFASLIPIFIFSNYKRACSMNLTTFFFPNFFFYLFLYRYSPIYFNSYFLTIFSRTIILSVFIAIVSIGLSFILMKIRKSKSKTHEKDLKLIASKNRITCPYCKMEFESIPKYCFNCLKEIIIIEDIKNE